MGLFNNASFKDDLLRLISSQRQEDEKRNAEIDESTRKMKAIQEWAFKNLTRTDLTHPGYINWLKEYHNQHGTEDMCVVPNNIEIYVATRSFELGELYGSFAMIILVPKGITVKANKIGHSTLLLPNGAMQSVVRVVYVAEETINYL